MQPEVAKLQRAKSVDGIARDDAYEFERQLIVIDRVRFDVRPCAFPRRTRLRRCYTLFMTMIDLGPERPGQPSETRQMGEQGRAKTHREEVNVSGRQFVIALVIISAVIAVFAFLLTR